MTTPNVVTEEMVEAAAREIGELRIQVDWRFVPSDDVARVALAAALPFFSAAPASAPGGEPKVYEDTVAQAVYQQALDCLRDEARTVSELCDESRRIKLAFLKALGFDGTWDVTVVNEKQMLERIAEMRSAINEACGIIEIGDQRLLAGDGPCGGLPPEISLDEWVRMYRVLDRARCQPSTATPSRAQVSNGA